MAKMKPIDVDLCNDNREEAIRLSSLLKVTNVSGRNMVVVDWLYGVLHKDVTVIRQYNERAFIGLSYRAYPAVKKLFLLNGYKVTPPTTRSKSYRLAKHPLSSFPFNFELTVNDDQLKWLRDNHWKVSKITD